MTLKLLLTLRSTTVKENNKENWTKEGLVAEMTYQKESKTFVFLCIKVNKDFKGSNNLFVGAQR